MAKIDCSKCEHCSRGSCDYDFRWAAGAAGQTVDDCEDVYFCQDFSEDEEGGYKNERFSH